MTTPSCVHLWTTDPSVVTLAATVAKRRPDDLLDLPSPKRFHHMTTWADTYLPLLNAERLPVESEPVPLEGPDRQVLDRQSK